MNTKQTEKPAVFNVFFKISEPLYDEIVEVSVEINHRFGSDFVADDRIHFPHLPLYLFAAPPRNRLKIIRAAHNLIEIIKPCVVKVEELASSESELVMVNLEKSEELYQYHLQALDLFNPLRERQQREKYKDRGYLASLPEKDRDYLARYGHRWVLDNYIPHITIAKIADPAIREKVIEAYRDRFMGRTAQIATLRIAEEFFSPVNKSVLVFDSPFLTGKR